MYSNTNYEPTNTPRQPNKSCFTAFSTYYIHKAQTKRTTLVVLEGLRKGKELVERMGMTETQWQELTRYRKTIAIDRAVFAMVGESNNVKFIGGNAKHITSWTI